ncbi:MAG: hypothetical protein E7141_04835 [Rikenellaceae bacterium]|nr:hypothetical protein [Rikenellaceae bacterium]
MREIKFRGKSFDTGEWVYGDYHKRAGGVHCIIKMEPDENGKVVYVVHQATPDTIGQFTGLLDKNGKEIYEGDIIRGNCGHGEVRHLISFYDMTASFVAEILPDNDINDYCTVSQIWILKYSKEVLGNIHDNPELLNE